MEANYDFSHLVVSFLNVSVANGSHCDCIVVENCFNGSHYYRTRIYGNVFVMHVLSVEELCKVTF